MSSGVRLLPQPDDKHLKGCHYCAAVLLDEAFSTRRPKITEALGIKSAA